nr:PREDICTED: uncharacterized protein LOC107078102 [Lepisosteus oculatus]
MPPMSPEARERANGMLQAGQEPRSDPGKEAASKSQGQRSRPRARSSDLWIAAPCWTLQEVSCCLGAGLPQGSGSGSGSEHTGTILDVWPALPSAVGRVPLSHGSGWSRHCVERHPEAEGRNCGDQRLPPGQSAGHIPAGKRRLRRIPEELQTVGGHSELSLAVPRDVRTTSPREHPCAAVATDNSRQDKMVVKMALVLLLLGAHTVSSQHQLCGTYYLGGNSQQNMTAKREDWTVKTFRSSVDLRKIMVYGNCLMLVDGIVYGSEDTRDKYYNVNKKVRHIECCCEFVNSASERFLNRHVIGTVPQNWNAEMKGRCIPINGRLMHTFIVTTADAVRRICGNRNQAIKQNCRSRNNFTIYNIERKQSGQYSNNAKRRKTEIAVTCENRLPVHFDCYVDNNNPDCINKYKVCK